MCIYIGNTIFLIYSISAYTIICIISLLYYIILSITYNALNVVILHKKEQQRLQYDLDAPEIRDLYNNIILCYRI